MDYEELLLSIALKYDHLSWVDDPEQYQDPINALEALEVHLDEMLDSIAYNQFDIVDIERAIQMIKDFINEQA